MGGMDPTETVRSTMPLCETLGITSSELAPERVVLELSWSPELCTSGGVLHGGALMTLADSAGAACAVLNLPEGSTGTSTVESSTKLLRAVRGGPVVATATPLHVGRSTIVVATELRSDGRLVATTTQTQIVLRD